MRSNKYILTGATGLILVGVAAFVMFRQDALFGNQYGLGDGSTNLFSYAPTQFDQVVYVDVEPELVTVLQEMEAVEIAQDAGLEMLLTRIDQLLVTQYTTVDQFHSLLFFEGDETFTSEDLQEFGLIAGDDSYMTQKLTDRIWVYGPDYSIAWYEQLVGESLADLPEIDAYWKEFLAGGYNVGFFSRPAALPTANPLATQFSQALEYTAVMSRLDPDDTAGRVIMQFSPDVVPEITAPYSPHFNSDQGVLFVEFADIVGLFGIDEQQFMGIFPILLGQQGPAFASLLSQDDYASIYQALHSYLALEVTPNSNSLMGLQIGLLMQSAEMFDILVRLRPLWTSLAESFVGSGGATINEGEDSFQILGSVVPGLQEDQTLLTVSRKEGVTSLVLFGDLSDSSLEANGHEIGTTDQTVATFKFDGASLQESLVSNPLANQNGLDLASEGLQGGIAQGHIDLLPARDQIVIGFTVDSTDAN